MKYCLKALIPDVFASSLLRDKGALKEQLQEESGSRLVFSNKGDFFPDTSLRVLGIYSDLSGAVAQALELILGRMKELAQDERGRYPPPGCEMLGKEEGELIFRLVLSREMTGLLIGSQGARIKQLRQDSGCKINIRDEAVAAHRLATFSGPFEALTIALQHVAENMQTEAETESDEFQNYAKVINFGEGKDWKEGGGWGYDAPPGKGSHGSHGQVSVFSSSGMATATGSLSMRLGGKGAGKHGQASGGLHLLGKELDLMPQGSAEMPYSISCAIPANLVPALIGRSGDFIRSIEERTGAKVDISREATGLDGYRKMECVGPLLSIYSAHTLMMHRLQGLEPSGPSGPPPGSRRPRSEQPVATVPARSFSDNPPKSQLEKQQELLTTIAELEKRLAVAKQDADTAV